MSYLTYIITYLTYANITNIDYTFLLVISYEFVSL
jgi:hypothetical protein